MLSRGGRSPQRAAQTDAIPENAVNMCFSPLASAKPAGRFSSLLLHYKSEYKEQYRADAKLNHTVWHKTFAQFHRVYTI